MPVDIAFGTVKLEYEDVSIPGKVPLVWDRRYSTALLEKPVTPLGHGWTSRYYASLTQHPGEFVFVTPEGAVETFADPEGLVARGGVVRNYGAFLEVFRLAERYVVQSWNVDTGEVRRYCFDAGQPRIAWKLSSIEDVTGQAVDLIWDSNGRLSSVRQRLEKRALVIGYNKRGFIERVELHAQNGERHPIATYEHDVSGRQVVARDAAEFGDRFEYDAAGRLTREIVKDGGVFHYRYDPQGRCVKRTGLGRYNEKRLRYIDAVRITEVTDSYERKFIYQYLPSGQTVLEIDPLGGRRITQFDKSGRIVAKEDATGAVTRYAYDVMGNRASTADALGHTTFYKYNEHHLLLSTTDADGQVWRSAYDQTYRLAGTVDPLNGRWLFRYDAEGNLTEVENPLGARKRQHYEDGVLRSLTDWLGNTTHFGFDVFGRVVERCGPLGDRTQFGYDSVGNSVQVTFGNGVMLRGRYDQAGNLTTLIDANGHATHWRYGSCGRLVERIDRTKRSVRYVWGRERGRLEHVINERGETYSFYRDRVGRVVCERSFDGTERRFQYDAEGYTTRYTNGNGETIAIERDPMHRVIRQHLPDRTQVRYAYDALGHLREATNSNISVKFERDAFGRVVRELQGDYWIASTYDSVGNLTRTETSLGHVLHYSNDANGFTVKLATARGANIDFTRDPYGQETLRKMPGGVWMRTNRDSVGRVIEQCVSAQTLSLTSSVTERAVPNHSIHRRYTYDRNGTVSGIQDRRWGDTQYTYDPAERIIRALSDRGKSERFDYDEVDNITCIAGQDGYAHRDVLLYGPGGRLLQKGETRYEYDSGGRLVRRVEAGADGAAVLSWCFDWDAQDRLMSVTRPDGEVWHYEYDALSRRVAK